MPDDEEHLEVAPAETQAPPFDDDAIRALVIRLARPHRSGGIVIERAAIMAEGARLDAVVAWIEANGGSPEARPAPARRSSGGLHGTRMSNVPDADKPPLRYVLPAGT